MAHCFSQQRKISDILTDKNEFPSLSEVSKKNKAKDSLQSDKSLRSYSDRLKISHPVESLPKKFSIGKKTFSEFIPGVPVAVETSENTSSENTCWTARHAKRNSTQPVLREFSQTTQRVEAVPNAWSRPVSIRQSPECPKAQSPQISKSRLPSENASKSNKKNSTDFKGKNPSSASKEIHKKIVSTECDAEGEVKKKRKRKSKIKRQAAFKSGKVSLVTPEIHSRITNQTKYSSHSTSNNVSTNIHDSEEYPELGKMVDMKKIKPVKKNVDSEKKNTDFITSENELSKNSEQLEQSPDNAKNTEGQQKASLKGAKLAEDCEESKTDQKSVVHTKDPITISFLDVLTASKPKVKENHEKRATVTPAVSSKISSKMIHSQPHNLLDSKPVAKRGKEREIPKAKKPSPMKKIILMDRKTRKEQLIQLKNSLNESKQDLPLLIQENKVSSTVNDNNSSNDCESSINNSVNLIADENAIDEQLTSNKENSANETDCEAEAIEEVEEDTYEDVTCVVNSEDECNQLIDSNEDLEQRDYSVTTTDHNEIEKPVNVKSCQNADAVTIKHIQMLNSMFGFTVSFEDDDLYKGSCLSVEERLKASKILIHTRNFREYCNHLPSQEIDEAVSALLSDLVRFQDRMHQKDPVKARIKRRFICGIKEVKKHLKLRKVKGVILATDVENVQTEGGLNDVLYDLKQSAADHQIPCVFALRKRKLGKLCHKPVAVSCIGIFNYEGSEGNFKKMIELLNQSKEDYEQIIKGVMAKLSDDDIKQLLKARLMAPENLMEIRNNILRKTLLENPKIEDMPNVEVAVES